MNLQNKIENVEISKNEIAIFWLGQAGFLIKDEFGRMVAVDPYLTDCGYRMKGFKRLSPKLLSPESLHADYYITTHLHFDHFDFDAIPIIAKNSNAKFYGPITCYNEMLKIGIDISRVNLLEEGTAIEDEGIKILPVYADHGDLAPDAVGIFLEMGSHKIYFSGDTAYRPEKVKNVAILKPDIAILSVNGAFGNLNGEEGAKLAHLVGAKIAIPCHLWTFREHGGDLSGFEKYMEEIAPNCKPYFMYQGECLILKSEV